MSMKEAVKHLSELHKDELAKLSLKARIAKMANLLAKYRLEHPDESAEWSAQYV